jgi:hypothetical protein
MKYLIYFLIILASLSCKKKAVDFRYEVSVQDYYSGNPISGQTLVLRQCRSGGIMAGSICDSIDSKVSDNNGKVIFTGTRQPSLNNQGHDFYLLKENGYAPSGYIDFAGWNDKRIVRAKPLVPLKLKLLAKAPVDSVTVEVSMPWLNPEMSYVTTSFRDSLDIIVNTVPDEENTITVWSILNDTYLGQTSVQYTPSLGQNNNLKIEIP